MMEEVLDSLEIARIRGEAEEREIQELTRALNRLQRMEERVEHSRHARHAAPEGGAQSDGQAPAEESEGATEANGEESPQTS